MTPTHTLAARAFREEGGWWTIEIPELTSPGPNGTTISATGGAVTPRGIEQAARELAAVWLDVTEEDVDINVTISIPEAITHLWTEGARAEADGRASIDRGAALRREAVRELRAQGYTVEAAARALGISRQRVQQLAKEPGSEKLAS